VPFDETVLGFILAKLATLPDKIRYRVGWAKRIILASTVGLMLVCPGGLSIPAAAVEAAAWADLQAAVRALGFLDSIQNRQTVSIGVVYANEADSNAANQTAGMLSSLRGIGPASVHATAIPLDELIRADRRFDVVYLMPGLVTNGNRIIEYVRQQRVVSVSNDPTCLNGGYCVLMVRAGAGVSIVLDTALANAAGARFASVFTLMVKRK